MLAFCVAQPQRLLQQTDSTPSQAANPFFFLTLKTSEIKPFGQTPNCDWECLMFNRASCLAHVCLQVLLLLRQMESTPTQATASKVSLLMLGQQAVMDAYLCLLHLTTGTICHRLCRVRAWGRRDVTRYVGSGVRVADMSLKKGSHGCLPVSAASDHRYHSLHMM